MKRRMTVARRECILRLNASIAARKLGIPVEEYRTNIRAGMKWCTRHKRWEPRDRFWKNRSRPDGLATICSQGMKELRVYG